MFHIESFHYCGGKMIQLFFQLKAKKYIMLVSQKCLALLLQHLNCFYFLITLSFWFTYRYWGLIHGAVYYVTSVLSCFYQRIILVFTVLGCYKSTNIDIIP